MIYILYGEDDFSLKEALDRLKDGLGDREMVATNTTRLQGQHLTPEQLITTCSTLPFLAPKRLVIVEGLLSRFEQQDGKGKHPPVAEFAGWKSFAEFVKQMPESTVLMLIDGRLKRNNHMLAQLEPVAKVNEFKPLKGDSLKSWIQSRAKNAGGAISPGALRLLADLIGSNLWLLSIEIDKLCLYAQGRAVEEDDVKALVSYAQVTNVFTMVDAILERKSALANRLLHRLEEEGAAPPYLLYMITRQLRMVIQAKDALLQKQVSSEFGQSLGITSDFVLQKVREQAKAHSMERLKGIYRKLLDADISIKTGRFKGDRGELALDLLISELCEERS